jgi:PAS domain S-box-containing protein
MNQKWDGIERRSSLRAEAEAMIATLSPKEEYPHPADILLHELLVHKIELEVQNEELRRIHAEIEKGRDYYMDLYEFAPISYITINRECRITAINLTGTALLGIDRPRLLNQHFSNFVTAHDQDRWHGLFLDMMAHDKGYKQEFGLEMETPNGSVFYGHLNCLRSESSDSPMMLRVALTDISKIERG